MWKNVIIYTKSKLKNNRDSKRSPDFLTKRERRHKATEKSNWSLYETQIHVQRMAR